jgi:hypothetical protein
METDLQRWTSYSSYELRDSMYAAVKAAAPRLLVGGYENAMGLTCQPGFGRYHINALLNSTTPDFMISLPGYGRYRDDCNHPIGLKVYNGSMVLHNKLLIYEMDIRNPEQGPLGIMCKSRNWQAEHNKSSFNNFIKLFTGTAMSWGGGFHAYLMQPHWWNTPAAIKTWTDAIKIAQNAQGCRLNNNRVAVMINEDSSFYAARKNIPAFFSRMNYKESTEYTLWKSGIRYDYYLPQDLFNPDFKAPKILFFADAQTMTPDDAQKIRKKYANSGRIIIWVGGAGYLPSGSIAAARAVTGFKIELDPRINNCPLWSSGKITDPLMKGISGFFYEWTYYCGGFSPHWKVDDPKAKTLACYYGTDIPGMAVKRYKKHTEIFIGQPGSISPQLMRNIARAAEIRPLLYSDDLFVTGAGLLSVGALTGNGIRKIYFPPGVKAMKCLTGQKITRTGKDFIELQMKYREAAVFKLFR